MIIGITGSAASGKSTLAGMIRDRHDCFILSFATPLKEMIVRANICRSSELYGKKTPFSRKMMQCIGTDLIRCQIDAEYWVKDMERRLEIFSKEKLVVIDDVRFMNEMYMVYDRGGLMVRIERNTPQTILSKIAKFRFRKTDKHISEAVLPINNGPSTRHIIVENNKGLKEIREAANKIVEVYVK